MQHIRGRKKRPWPLSAPEEALRVDRRGAGWNNHFLAEAEYWLWLKLKHWILNLQIECKWFKSNIRFVFEISNIHTSLASTHIQCSFTLIITCTFVVFSRFLYLMSSKFQASFSYLIFVLWILLNIFPEILKPLQRICGQGLHIPKIQGIFQK